MFADTLNVGAYFYGKAERIIDIADFARMLLQQIENITPWSRPFDVSGDKKTVSNMPVNEDLSNFNDLLFQAWKSSTGVYYDAEDVRTLDFSEFHTVKSGVATTFSNFAQCQIQSDRVSIRLLIGRDHDGGETKAVPNVVLVSIRKFSDGELNAGWNRRDIVERLMHCLINLVNPYECSAFSSQNTINEVDGIPLLYKFNWLTYLAVDEVCSLLSENEFASEFGDGLWFDFGRDVSTVFDPCVRDAAEDIGRKLIEANLV